MEKINTAALCPKHNYNVLQLSTFWLRWKKCWQQIQYLTILRHLYSLEKTWDSPPCPSNFYTTVYFQYLFWSGKYFQISTRISVLLTLNKHCQMICSSKNNIHVWSPVQNSTLLHEILRTLKFCDFANILYFESPKFCIFPVRWVFSWQFYVKGPKLK